MFLFLFYLFNLDVMHGSYDIYISTAYFLNINVVFEDSITNSSLS